MSTDTRTARAFLAMAAACGMASAFADISLTPISDRAGDIDYVRQTTGSKGYFLTDIELTSEDAVEVVFKIDDTVTESSGVFGCREAADANNISILYDTKDVVLDFNNGDYEPYRCTASLAAATNRWLIATVSRDARRLRDFHSGELLAENTNFCDHVFTAGAEGTREVGFFAVRHSKITRGSPLVRYAKITRNGKVRSHWTAYSDANGNRGFRDCKSGTFLTEAYYKKDKYSSNTAKLEFGDLLPAVNRLGVLTEKLHLASNSTPCTISGMAVPSEYADKFDSAHVSLIANGVRNDHINLDFTMKTNYNIEVRFKLRTKPTEITGIFGRRDAASTNNFSAIMDEKGIYADFNNSDYETYRAKSSAPVAGHVYTITISRKFRKIVDETIGEIWENNTVCNDQCLFGTEKCYIFKVNGHWSKIPPDIELKYFKMHREEDDGSITVLRDLRPAMLDGVAGLYDMSGRLKSINENPFVCNANVTPPFTCGELSPDYPAPIAATFGTGFSSGDHELQMRGLANNSAYTVHYMATNATERVRYPATGGLDVLTPPPPTGLLMLVE